MTVNPPDNDYRLLARVDQRTLDILDRLKDLAIRITELERDQNALHSAADKRIQVLEAASRSDHESRIRKLEDAQGRLLAIGATVFVFLQVAIPFARDLFHLGTQ